MWEKLCIYRIIRKSPYLGINCMLSAYAVGQIGSFQVIGLVVVVPWTGLRYLQTSPHLIFICGGHLKAMVYQVIIQNMELLKESIRDACDRITLDVLKRVCPEWARRIRMCYECNGAYIQHVLCVNKETISPCIETFESHCRQLVIL